MPSIRKPRAGSLQFWPRKRAKRAYPRTRTFLDSKEQGLTGFSGYKVGMTHIMAIETNKHSPRKGEEVSFPVTIIECPPLKLAAIRLYKNTNRKLFVTKEILLQKKDKQLFKRLKQTKKNLQDISKLKPEDYNDVRVLVYTQPLLTSLGKKKPELFELGLGGTVEEKLAFVNENKDKELNIESFFKDGDLLDVKAITKGKGFQGPVKRFGITIRQAKSEKSIRNPGSLGPWKGQGGIMWRVAHAGKMGYHQRTEYNKQLLKIVSDPKELLPSGGFLKYGNVKNPVILVKGSIGGSRKRLVVFHKPQRVKKQAQLPTLESISFESKQGN